VPLEYVKEDVMTIKKLRIYQKRANRRLIQLEQTDQVIVMHLVDQLYRLRGAVARKAAR
jgi:hypothetical protein